MVRRIAGCDREMLMSRILGAGIYTEAFYVASRLPIFFFSSRRRHTRLTCDWSSDVCSSDLGLVRVIGAWLGRRHLSRLPLLGAGPTTPFPGALSRRFKWLGGPLGNFGGALFEIGRASCRERVCVSVGVVPRTISNND